MLLCLRALIKKYQFHLLLNCKKLENRFYLEDNSSLNSTDHTFGDLKRSLFLGLFVSLLRVLRFCSVVTLLFILVLSLELFVQFIDTWRLCALSLLVTFLVIIITLLVGTGSSRATLVPGSRRKWP
jgi:hypothetical protein